MKISKTLLFYFIAYNLVTIYFISEMYRDQSASLGYVLLFPIFWGIAGVILGILLWRKKIKISSWVDKILIACSTPIPVFILLAFQSTLSGGLITSSYEFNKNGHRHREVKYQYSSGGQTRRLEYYVSKDDVTDTNPFPTSDIWLKDSIWIFFKRDGTVEKKEDYRTK